MGEGKAQAKGALPGPDGVVRGFAGMPAVWKSTNSPLSRGAYYNQSNTLVDQRPLSPLRVTKSMLDIHRRMASRTDTSYDLDGDGAVSQRDFYLSSQFDSDADGKLNEAEKQTFQAGTVMERGEYHFANSSSRTQELPKYLLPGESRTRSQLLQERKIQSREASSRLERTVQSRLKSAHHQFKQTLPKTYPYSQSIIQKPHWGPNLTLDKICVVRRGVSADYMSSSEVPKAFSSTRNLESREYGAGYQGRGARPITAEEWAVRQRRHKNQIPDKRGQVLSLAEYHPKHSTFGDTYRNIVSGSSGPGYDVRLSTANSFFNGTRMSRGQIRAHAARVNNGRDGGPIRTATVVHEYDPWFTHGNPQGKVLQDKTKQNTVGGRSVAATPAHQGAGVTSGYEHARGRGHVVPGAVYSNGNTTVSPIVPQSKFAYNAFDRDVVGGH